MKKYISPILYIGTLLMLFYTLFDLKDQVKQIPVLNKQIDSLNTELFIQHVDAGRHELIREEFLKQTYPKIYEEYYKKYQSETE